MSEQRQLAGDAPQLYQRHLVPAMTAMWAADLAERTAVPTEPGSGGMALSRPGTG